MPQDSTKEAQIEATVTTLVNVIRHQERRLRNAMAMRKTIGEALARGEDPVHYRLDFIRSSVLRVNDALAECARQFDEEHPDDRCSAADFIDILATTRHRMESALRRRG